MQQIRLLAAAGLCAAIGFGSSGALAAPYLPDRVQLLEDQDAEVLLDSTGAEIIVGASTQIVAGNLFAGVFKIQATKNVAPDGPDVNLQGAVETFTAIFLIDVKSTTNATGVPSDLQETVTFGAPTQAQWTAVFGAAGILDISSEFSVAGLASGTMAILFNGVVYEDALTSDADPPAVPVNTLTYAQSATTFVAGGTAQYEFGFTGAGGIAGTDEFWNTQGINATFPALVGSTNPTNRFALDITAQLAGPDLTPHNHLLDEGNDANFTGPTDIQGKGDFAGTSSGPWGIITDTDLYIDAVPEPTSLALMSLGLLGLGFAGLRRKAS